MDTIKVLKGNVELDIPAYDKDRYKKLGYSVIDNNGKVIEQAPITDVGTLQVMVAELQAENAQLKEEISKLKAKKPATTKSAKTAE